MERLNGTSSKELTGNESHQAPEKPENDESEKQPCPNVQRELSNLFSQIQMMSDSLAACSQMSKHRALRKATNVSEKINTHLHLTHQSSVQILLPTEDKVLDGKPNDGRENVIVSYVTKFKRDAKNLQRSRAFGSREDQLSRSSSDERMGSGVSDRFCPKLRSLSSSSEDSLGLKRRSSKVGMYESSKVIPERMIDVIQRELKTLMNLAPPAALILTNMSDAMFHYKGCSRCRNKISPAFPWILNRLQKLIKFITTKRHGTYSWPNDYSYLQLVADEPTVDEPEEEKNFQCDNFGSAPEELIVQLEQSEKVDAFAIAEGCPGVQVLLAVKPKLAKKRLFSKVGWNFEGNLTGQYPVVQFEESSDLPIFLELRPSPEPRVVWDEKRALLLPKVLSYRFLLKSKPPLLLPELISFPTPFGQITRVRKPKSKVRYEVATLYHYPNYKRISKLVNQSRNPKQKSNEKKSYVPKNTLKEVSGLLLDFLKESEEDKMQIQKVEELELEVKELKDLLLDVHKNQTELSKVLLKKGIYSRPIIKFTDPEMLHEEDWVVNKVSEIELHKTRTSSLEAIQKTVGDLKQKCNLKNRILLTLLKGFQSNIPKEWWEEILSAMFKESTEEDLDPERISEFIRQTSFFLMNGEQAPRTLLPTTRLNEKASKEEPNMKGNTGADVQDNLKILSDLDDKWAKIMDDTLLPPERQYPMRIFAYPAVVPENLNSSVRKLEYQVSVLNVENERLWHEILDLRDVLMSSMKGLNNKISERASDKRLSINPPIKSHGKTINVTIQITSDKDHRLSRDSGILKITKVNETSPKTNVNKSSRSPPVAKPADPEFPLKEYPSYEEYIQNKRLAVLATGSKLQQRSERRRSKNDFSYLDDLTTVSPSRQEDERLKGYLRERAFGRTSNPPVEQVMVANPHHSDHGLWKNIQAVPSMHMVSEATTSYQAGPSRKRLEVEDFFQSPSSVEVPEGQSDDVSLSISKDRELHPIPEDDNLDPRSSGSINEAIQRLRARVRSIHKDVTVLKSKNDRIDKVLNRLVDDIKSNNESFEEIQETLYLNNKK